MNIPEITDAIRAKVEYTEGDMAFSNFIDVDDCPYDSAFMGSEEPRSDERLAWMAGWYDAKYREKFPKLFGETD